MRRTLLRAALAAALAPLAPPGAAQERAAREHEIKAAFLFKFLSFVEWPPRALAAGPLAIGVLGAEAVATDLQQVVSGRTAQGRALAVRLLRGGESLGDAQVLFVGAEHSARLPQLARVAQPQNVLLVSEAERGLDLGSVINFVTEGGRVRFEVSLEAAERSGLRISSRMLAVASEVRPARP